MGSKFGTSFLIQKAFPICLLNNSRLNMDKYLFQFHVMKINELCPCFKQHHKIIVNPVKIYTSLIAIDTPEPEIVEEEEIPVIVPEQPELPPVEIQEEIISNKSDEENPPENEIHQEELDAEQNSHPPLFIQNNNAQNIDIEPHDNQQQVLAQEPVDDSDNAQQRIVNDQIIPKIIEGPEEGPGIDQSQNAMYSSNNPMNDRKMSIPQNRMEALDNNVSEGTLLKPEEEPDLSFLAEDGESLFSSGFDDSFELSEVQRDNNPVNPSKFRFR